MSRYFDEANFMGREGYRWWIGVVEDRQDPLKLGRLRIRILGWHTEDKTLIPTCQLHWAWFQQPVTSAAMNGIGQSPTGPVEGSWTHGFMRDSDSGQEPIIVGTLGGVPQNAPMPCIGFNDPSIPFHDVFGNAPRKYYSRYYPNDGTGAQVINEPTAQLYPRTFHPWGCVVGESDTNRLARGEMLSDTINGVKMRQRDVHIPIALAHTTPSRQWNEPLWPGAPIYPYNHVTESESGHITEVDDTPGNERLHIYHKSGTFIEVYGTPGQEGDTVIKVVGKHWQVVMENSYQHFQNACNMTIDGEMNIYSRSDVNWQVDGNMKLHIQGNFEQKVGGNHTVDIGGVELIHIGSAQEVHVLGNQELLVGGNILMDAQGGITISAGGAFNESAGANFMMAAGGILSADAPMIYFNSGFGHTIPPIAPNPPVIPPFPAPLGRFETRNETGPDPVLEQKIPVPTPPTCSGQNNC